MQSCIIIGAGMAGLTVARQLAGQGWNVTVLDKGRGVGGRLATRRLANGRADHGAQLIRAVTPAFREWLSAPGQTPVLATWAGDPAGETGWIGRKGMSSIAKHLASGLTVETGQTVVSVSSDSEGWRVDTQAGSTYRADALVCTIPAPQAVTLFANSTVSLSAADLRVLQAIAYDPCLAVLVTLREPSLIPPPGRLRPDRPGVAWLADNQQKGISPDQPTATVLATTAFTRQYLESDLTVAGDRLMSELTDWLPRPLIESVQVHRWRYSQVTQACPQPFWRADTSLPLLFGGDGFGGSGPYDPYLNVERAHLSGLRMADALSGVSAV